MRRLKIDGTGIFLTYASYTRVFGGSVRDAADGAAPGLRGELGAAFARAAARAAGAPERAVRAWMEAPDGPGQAGRSLAGRLSGLATRQDAWLASVLQAASLE